MATSENTERDDRLHVRTRGRALFHVQLGTQMRTMEPSDRQALEVDLLQLGKEANVCYEFVAATAEGDDSDEGDGALLRGLHVNILAAKELFVQILEFYGLLHATDNDMSQDEVRQESPSEGTVVISDSSGESTSLAISIGQFKLRAMSLDGCKALESDLLLLENETGVRVEVLRRIGADTTVERVVLHGDQNSEAMHEAQTLLWELLSFHGLAVEPRPCLASPSCSKRSHVDAEVAERIVRSHVQDQFGRDVLRKKLAEAKEKYQRKVKRQRNSSHEGASLLLT